MSSFFPRHYSRCSSFKTCLKILCYFSQQEVGVSSSSLESPQFCHFALNIEVTLTSEARSQKVKELPPGSLGMLPLGQPGPCERSDCRDTPGWKTAQRNFQGSSWHPRGTVGGSPHVWSARARLQRIPKATAGAPAPEAPSQSPFPTSVPTASASIRAVTWPWFYVTRFVMIRYAAIKSRTEIWYLRMEGCSNKNLKTQHTGIKTRWKDLRRLLAEAWRPRGSCWWRLKEKHRKRYFI